VSRHLSIGVALLLCSCTGGGEVTTTSTPCESPVPARAQKGVPNQLRLGRHATITKVAGRGKAVGVTAVSDLSVVELYPPLARAILDAGYSIVSSDNEGFEAEIFFGDDSTTGAYRLREGPCPGQVTVRLLFDESRRKESS